MEIYLVRHTKTNTQNGLCYGQTDVPLAESFYDDTREILKKLPTNALVLSSPLTRCIRLAQLISDDVILDNRLLEINFGVWENVLFSDIEPEKLQQWTDSFVTFSPPNGENFTQLCQRTESFWHDLLLLENTHIVIVTHAGIIRALLATILKLPLANAFQFDVNLGSVHKLRYENQYTYIEFLNLI